MKRLFIQIILLAVCIGAMAQNFASQERYMYFAGFQINPYLKEAYMQDNSYATVYSLRAGVEPIQNFRVGLEWHKFVGQAYNDKINITNYGVFSRYLLFNGVIQPFAEAAAFYSIGKQTSFGIPYNKNEFDYYLAPGCAFNFFRGKLSADIMLLFNHKYSKKTFGIFEPTFRINYRFNIKK